MNTYKLLLITSLLAGCSVNVMQPSIGSGNRVDARAKTRINVDTGRRDSAGSNSSVDEVDEEDEDLRGESGHDPAPEVTPTPAPDSSSAARNERWIMQTSGTEEDLQDLCFVNTQTGYVVGKGTTVLKTTDGGGTWKALPAAGLQGEYDLTCVWFTSAESGVIGTGSGKLYATSDGGESWSLAFTNPQLDLQSKPWKFSDIRFVESQVGYAAGRHLYKTSDGGATWAKENIGCTAQAIDVHDGKLAAGGPSCIVEFVSGAGWEKTAEDTSMDIFGQVSLASNSTTWSSSGPFLQRVDAGGSVVWVKPKTIKGDEIRLRATGVPGGIDFVDGDAGWLVNASSVISTTDGGKTWTATSVGRELLTGIQMLDKENGWIVGFGGTVARYIAR